MSPRASSVPAAILGVILLGCGSKEAGAPGAARDAPRAPEPAQWFRGRLRQLPPWGDDLRRRIDPAGDDWPTETWALRIERDLPALLAAALAGDRRGLEAALAPDFEGATALWPAAFETVLDDGEMTVRRGKDLASAREPRTALAGIVDAWAGSLRDAPGARVDVAVDGLAPKGDARFETRIRMRVSGPAGEGSVQQNVRWIAVWRQPEGGGADVLPRLVSLALESLEEVRTRVRPIAELTREVLGTCDGFAEEILRGAGDYHLHQDRLSQQPFLGMHGLAVGDVDGDGLEDLYLPQPGGQPNRLLLHQPDGTVRDGAPAAHLQVLDNCGAALILDFDNDGDEDIAVAAGPNILVGWNDGHGRFTDSTLLEAPDAPEITSMSAADPDGDGDLDIYACRYVHGGVSNGVPTPYWNAQNGAMDLYWRNEGNHAFVEAAKEVGFAAHGSRYGLAVMWEDLDEDGDVDLYLVNDFGKNCFYRNDGGKFTDVAEEAGAALPAAGMGVTCADVDHDGNLDLFLTNMDSAAGARITTDPRFQPQHPETLAAYQRHARGNTLLLGDGHGHFRDATDAAGVGPSGWAWGGEFFDLQNDGWPDLYVPNGFVTERDDHDMASYFWRRIVARSPAEEPASEEYSNAWDTIRHFSLFEGRSWNGRERNDAYVNLGGARFAECSSALGVDFIDDARVVIPMDWDDDGRVDLWVRNRTGPRLRFLRNVEPSTGHWLALDLAGTTCNRDAVGARAFVEAGGVRLRQTVYAGDGFMCSGSRRLHFGLAGAKKADKIEIHWPGGGTQTFTGVAADARYRVVQGRDEIVKVPARTHPELAKKPADPVQVERRDESRIVLYERLPARALELPSAGPANQTVAALQGRAFLVCVGVPQDPASKFVHEALAARKKELEGLGVPLLAFECGEGQADKRFLQDLQVLVMEVLGPFDRLAYPLTLLFDRGGALTVVYSGVPSIDDVLADAATTRGLDPAALTTEPLLRGKWARPAPRNVEGLAQIFDLLGRSELGSYYHALARQRAGR